MASRAFEEAWELMGMNPLPPDIVERMRALRAQITDPVEEQRFGDLWASLRWQRPLETRPPAPPGLG
jgi:hypothetical protein